MSTNQILSLLELLQARPGLTGPELASRLGVQERSVRRYVARLGELGVPVVAGRGRYGGYRLLPGYRLPPLMLSQDEAAAVVVSLLVGRRAGVVAGVDSALAKIERVLPEALAERVRALEETVALTGRAVQAAPAASEVVLSLADAARRRRRVRVAYREAGALREVDPYGLVLHSGRWYLTGHDHSRGQVRTFRVDRVVSVEVLAGSFTDPEGFDPVSQVLSSLAAVPWRHEVEVVLHTTIDEARARIPLTVGTLVETDEGVRLSARAERLEGVARMLAGIGWRFRVVGPVELADAVRALAAELAECASVR